MVLLIRQELPRPSQQKARTGHPCLKMLFNKKPLGRATRPDVTKDTSKDVAHGTTTAAKKTGSAVDTGAKKAVDAVKQ